MTAIDIQNTDIKNLIFYAREKAARPGSSAYYSLLYLPEKYLPAALAMRAFGREISEIAVECSDAPLAQQKLRWWLIELERLNQHPAAPTHPVTQLLHSVLVKCTHHQQFMADFISELKNITFAYLDNIQTPIYSCQQDLLQFYQHTAGKLESLLGLLLFSLGTIDHSATRKTTENTEYFIKNIAPNLNQLGIFSALTQDLRDTRLLLQHGRMAASGDMLASHHVTLQLLSRCQSTPEIQQLFAAEASLAAAHYQPAFNDLLQHKKQQAHAIALQPAMLLAKLRWVLLKQLIKDDLPLLTQRIALTPLCKWWVAWRHK